MLRPTWLVAGFGCRQDCSAQELEALLDRALALAGLQRRALQGLATLDRRTDAPGLQALASGIGLPLAGYTAADLLPFEGLLSHLSEVSRRHTGCPGVAESAALAHCQALGKAPSHLLLHRQCSAHATVALAISS